MTGLDTTIIRPSAQANNFGFIIASDTEALRYGYSGYERQEFFNIDFFDGLTHEYFEDIQQAYLWLYKMILQYNHITVIMHNMSYDAQIMGLIDFVVRKRFYDLELKQAIT